MVQAIPSHTPTVEGIVPAGGYAAGQVIQLGDGRAARISGLKALVAGEVYAAEVTGPWRLPKTSGIALLDGGRAFLDHSTGLVHFKRQGDRDFYLGVVEGDFAGTDSYCVVRPNVEQRNTVDLARDPFSSVTVGTAAAGGFGRPIRIGGLHKFLITATNEAQKADLLADERFAPAALPIVEAILNVVSDGAGTNTDVNVGLANGTHASDFDSVTEYLACHLDGNTADIRFQSKDSGTTVASADSTKDYTEGTPFEVWFDCRDLSNIKIYVNGERVLSGSTFKLNVAAGPLALIAHVEKASSTDTYELNVDRLVARTRQAA